MSEASPRLAMKECPLCSTPMKPTDEQDYLLDVCPKCSSNELDWAKAALAKANQIIDRLRDGRRAHTKRRRQLVQARNKLGKQVYNLGEKLTQKQEELKRLYALLESKTFEGRRQELGKRLRELWVAMMA